MKLWPSKIRFRIREKLGLIAVTFILPISVLSFYIIETIARDIRFTALEIKGNAYQRSVEEVLEAVTNLRIGDSRERTTYVSQGEKAFAGLETVHALLAEDLQFTQEGLAKRKRSHLTMSNLRDKWAALRSSPENGKKAEALISDLRAMIVHAGDTSNLILDPDLDTYYLMDVTLLALPQEQDRIQEILAYITAVAGNGPLNREATMRLNVYAALLQQSDLDRISASAATALLEDANFLGASESLQAKLPPASKLHAEKVSKFIDQIRALAAGGSQAKTIEAGREALAASFAFWHVTVTENDLLMQRRVDAHKGIRLKAFASSLLLLAVALFVAWLIARNITRPFNEIVIQIENMAAGDLQFKQGEVRNDEIGTILNSLHLMAGRLKGTLQEIHQSASEISLAAQQVASTAEMLNNGAMDQAAHVEETGAALGEMVNLIQKNAQNAVETDKTASVAVAVTQTGVENIRDAVASMKNISERIQIVQEIAAQTNLLALNATIEAARAGEHGRGFAVVATEVGKLAETSGQAAKQIQALLRDSSAVSENAAASLNLITDGMQNTAQKVVAIREASEEQNQAAQQISETMGRLNQTTEQTASAAEELAATAEEMSSQTATLLEGLKFFRFSSESAPISNSYSAANALKQAMAARSSRVSQNVAGAGSAPLVVHSGSYEKF